MVIRVDKNYLENIFEPNRRELEKKLGIKLSQTQFTKYLARANLGFKFPKHKGIPKQYRRK